MRAAYSVNNFPSVPNSRPQPIIATATTRFMRSENHRHTCVLDSLWTERYDRPQSLPGSTYGLAGTIRRISSQQT